MKLIALAIFLGLALIAAVIFSTNRYEVALDRYSLIGRAGEVKGQEVEFERTWRIDKFTGKVRLCIYRAEKQSDDSYIGCLYFGR